MSGNTGTLGDSIVAKPGGQAYFKLSYVPNAVNIRNDDPDLDGACVVAWLYPDTSSPPVVTESSVASEAGITIRPPGPSGDGNPVQALVIFNTGQAPLNCAPH